MEVQESEGLAPCLDTDFLVALHRRRAEALKALEEFEAEGIPLTTTPLTACELIRGAYLSRKQEESLRECQAILSRLEMLEYAPAVADNFGRITSSLGRGGSQIGEVDAFIASYALAHAQPIVTRNVREFRRVPGLTVLTW